MQNLRLRFLSSHETSRFSAKLLVVVAFPASVSALLFSLPIDSGITVHSQEFSKVDIER